MTFARVLMHGTLLATRYHQAQMGPVVHPVRDNDFVERGAHFGRAQPDIDSYGAGAVVEPPQMVLDQHQSAVAQPDTLPHAVAEAETSIEDRDQCLGATHEPPVEPDQEVAIARILSGALCALRLDQSVNPLPAFLAHEIGTCRDSSE